jgi:hypothetical protein
MNSKQVENFLALVSGFDFHSNTGLGVERFVNKSIGDIFSDDNYNCVELKFKSVAYITGELFKDEQILEFVAMQNGKDFYILWLT